eukprot:CAMPEP_0181318704 /NCGR_PEP_ID=MMETSP1101-20121128/17152_1 /TAXON_ID=46948 /ORGANISM="Rhodomonas abbreviata, Strain Caron Lab Isolate" /LENGTH=433 /DNA_ID=CAMNT_0023426199 /DNA_START=9 /DNA_END=1311 /DNA_ORIENTATION=+
MVSSIECGGEGNMRGTSRTAAMLWPRVVVGIAAAAVAVSALVLLSGIFYADNVGRVGLLGSGGAPMVAVPEKLLKQMSNELAVDSKTIQALNTHVSRLDSIVAHGKGAALQHRGRAATMTKMTDTENAHDAALVARATSSAEHEKTVAMANAKRVLAEKQLDLLRDFPYWAANSAQSDAAKGHGQYGEWRVNRGPPYVAATTLFSGEGVDRGGSGNLVRRIVGIKTSFRFHKWEGDSFLVDFDGPQFRYEYRNTHSQLIIPPLEVGGGPLLGWNAIHRLYMYVNHGHNSLIVAGGPASVLFINSNVINTDGGYDMEPKWVEGPYERQKAAEGTPFAACATTLPGPGTQVHGVAISSLPREAISYYEAGDVSVVFEIPSGEGRILFLGFDYTEPVVPWVHALIAATQFTEFSIADEQRAMSSDESGRAGVVDAG